MSTAFNKKYLWTTCPYISFMIYVVCKMCVKFSSLAYVFRSFLVRTLCLRAADWLQQAGLEVMLIFFANNLPDY